MNPKGKLGLLISAALILTTGGVISPAAASASSPPICTVNDPENNGCANRNGGGTANGTDIILWHNDGDANNDFVYHQVTSECENGMVTRICPFSDTSIDTRYLSDSIYELAAGNVSGKCIASSSGFVPQLWPCGNDGYLFVRSSLGYLVNVFATNHEGGIRWLNSLGIFGDSLVFGTTAIDAWTGP